MLHKFLGITILVCLFLIGHSQTNQLSKAIVDFNAASINLKPWLANNQLPAQHETNSTLQSGAKRMLNLDITILKNRLSKLINSKSDSILIIGLSPNDSLIVSGNWTCYTDILVFGSGKLRFKNANITMYGDLYTWGETAEITADSSYIYMPQQYFYQRSIVALGGSKVVFNQVTLDFSELSHSFLASDSSKVIFNNVTKKGFTTNSVNGKASYTINKTNLAGEFVIEKSSHLKLKDARTVLLWHVIPEEAMFHFSFPAPDTVSSYQFHPQLSGITNIDYFIDVENCTDVMWAIMPKSNSDVKILDSKMRAVGLWFTSSDSTIVKGLVNNSEYSNFTVPIAERNLQLINSSVQTWNLYPMKNSNISINSCILGEIGAQGTSKVFTNSVFVDGSGGYMWGTDTTYTMAFSTPITTSIRSQGNGIVLFAYSPLSYGTALSVDNSMLLVLQSQLPEEPIAYDKSSVWHLNILSPSIANTNSKVLVKGFAIIDLAPQSFHPKMSWYRLYYSSLGNDSLIAITPKIYEEKRNDTLALWNTKGLPDGQYLLHLEVANSVQNPLQIKVVKSISLLAGSNGTEEIPAQCTKIFPNPCENYLIIDTENKFTKHTIIDNSGRILSVGNVEKSRTKIDVTNLPTGNYVLKLENKNESHVLKFIKL